MAGADLGGEPVRPRSRPPLLFINGFHRSGTTLLTSAVTEAVGGVTTTVGSLARHIPAVRGFLAGGAGTSDRGVDRLEVTERTTEEYGFLLSYRTGERALYGHPACVPLLREHISELTAEAPGATVVLKNPWEVGHEAQMLRDFPDARIIILRRRMADIERSIAAALVRTSSSAYARALEPDEAGHLHYQRQIRSRRQRAMLLGAYRWALRAHVYRLAGSVGRLPPERIALLSYDELRADPGSGAAWAGHLVDPQALARAFARLAFEDRPVPVRSSIVHRILDRRWRRSWDAVRQAQVRAGILSSPSEDPHVATCLLTNEPLPGRDGASTRRVRPVRAALALLFRAVPQLVPRVEKLLWRGVYEVASLRGSEAQPALMNYGYAPLGGSDEDVEACDDEFGLRLYAAVAGAVDLSGKDVLEVSCGRGGGSAFVFERFNPRSVTGLDLAHKAIARGRARYSRPGLTFVPGDAEDLPFGDETFDVVLSVEATHCYSDVPRFLAEVRRVLRPGGVLLLADFRHTRLGPEQENALVPQGDVDGLRQELADAGFQTLEEEDITRNVLRALQLDTPRRRAQIERRVPAPLRRHALAFAALEGGPMYRGFAEGNWTYLRLAVEKTERAAQSPNNPGEVETDSGAESTVPPAPLG